MRREGDECDVAFCEAATRYRPQFPTTPGLGRTLGTVNDVRIPTATELLEHVRAALARLDDRAAAVQRHSDCPGDPVYDRASTWTNVVLNIVLDLGEAAYSGLTRGPVPTAPGG
jgi:hypothetical protein